MNRYEKVRKPCPHRIGRKERTPIMTKERNIPLHLPTPPGPSPDRPDKGAAERPQRERDADGHTA